MPMHPSPSAETSRSPSLRCFMRSILSRYSLRWNNSSILQLSGRAAIFGSVTATGSRPPSLLASPPTSRAGVQVRAPAPGGGSARARPATRPPRHPRRAGRLGPMSQQQLADSLDFDELPRAGWTSSAAGPSDSATRAPLPRGGLLRGAAHRLQPVAKQSQEASSSSDRCGAEDAGLLCAACCLSDFEGARPLLAGAEERAKASGDEGTRAHLLFHGFQVEWFTGRWTEANRLATEALQLADQLRDEQYRRMRLYARARLDAHRRAQATRGGRRGACTADAHSDSLVGLQTRTVARIPELTR